MVANICVVGSGNIGSRHIQSLATSSSNINIFVMDPNKENLKKTKKLFFKNNNENGNKINISFEQSMNKIYEPIDLAIISTNSDVRKDVIEKLLSINDVKNIIVEKIAFQNMNDFDFVIKLLDEKKIKSYVNFPRRIYQSYQNLKKQIINQKKIHISNVGTNIGLASNSLHLLDLLLYLTNANKIYVEEISLKNKIFESSRKGFIELEGALKFSTDRGDTLHLFDCDRDSISKSFGGIKIENENFSYSIYEKYQKIIKVEYFKNLSVKVEDFIIPRQSELTNSIVEEILNNNKITLPNLKETYYCHKVILEIFTNHLKLYNKNISGCPIT